MSKHKCSDCPHWKWHKKDSLYGTPGYHQCDEPDYCDRFRKKKIQRDYAGFITDQCLADMEASLPIEVFVNFDTEPHGTINNEQELERYLFGAVPYALTTYYREKEDSHE